MKTNRRNFIAKAVAGGLAVASNPFASASAVQNSGAKLDLNSRYAKLDAILKQPLLKRNLFTTPVIIDTLELLRSGDSFLCRVRSKDGAEGIAVGHINLRRLWPIFIDNLQDFFIGQDARELDLLLEKVYLYRLNFRYNGLPLGVPLATIEHAILDMLGKIAKKSVGELIGEIHNPYVSVYMATEYRRFPLEQHFELIKERVSQYDVKALKIKVGHQWIYPEDLHHPGHPGKAEKLIPLVREHYGDSFTLYADANGYYDVGEAIKIGRLLEEYNYGYFEEPVLYWHFEDIKAVADALKIPIANGEQDQSYYNFRWLIANDGIDIVQPDNYYFGGFIRGMKVALMANAFGKTCIPHMSSGGLGYLYACHFVSAMPNFGAHLETHGTRTNVPFECATSSCEISDGKIKVPTGPGLGITIDPDFIKRHQVVKMA